MKKQKHKDISPELERHLGFCQREYERMVREGTWLWPDWEVQLDSTLSKGVVDSIGNPENV